MAKPPPHDVVPDWIPPCLPTLVSEPPDGAGWQHEIKWDGYRVSVHLADGVATVRTRNGHDWTARFPTIAAAVASLPIHSLILDGEAVVLDDAGQSDFAALQKALGTGGRGPGKRAAHEATLYAFDLLALDGHDLRPWRLSDRQDALLAQVGADHPVLRVSEPFPVPAGDLFAAVADLGMEGIVSKRSDEPYSSGRSTSWLKTKCVRDATFVVVGYQPSASRTGRLGALHVARDDGGTLHYAGAVGTGFSSAAAADLQRRLDRLGKPASAVPGLDIKGAHWTAPRLRVDVNFRSVTPNGTLRHASFKGIRDDL